MPTREESVHTLYSLINSGILSEELEEQLEDIARCIESEDADNNLGVFLWGIEENDWMDLYTARRSDLITPEWEKHCHELYEKYRIKG